MRKGKWLYKALSLLLCCTILAPLWQSGVSADESGQTSTYYDEIRQELEESGITNYQFILGGEDEESTYRFFRHNKVTNFGVVDVEDAPFEKALNIEVTQEVPHDYDISTSCDLPVEVKEGQNIWLRFYVKSMTGEEVKLCAAIKSLPDYQDWLNWNGTRTVAGDNGWVQFDFFAQAVKDAPPRTTERAFLDFVFGYYIQHLQLGGITLVCLPEATDMQIDALSGRLDYEGREPDAPWRAKAQEMIEENRMGDLQINLKNPDGTPLADAEIQVEMTEHDYTFGMAMDAADLLEISAYQERREMVFDLFNTVVLINDLKWPAWVGDWGSGFNHEDTIEAVDYLLSRGKRVVGHVLVWPGFNNMPNYIKEMKDDPEGIRAEIEAHIREMVGLFKGKISAWDVVNEAYDNNDITQLLDEDGINDPQSLIDWFEIAHEVDPDCKLTYNDYGMFGTNNDAHYEYMRFISQYLKENGAPIDMIGAQSYFSLDTIVGPEEVWRRLDDYYAQTGLPVKLSEFTLRMNNRNDENMQAFQYDYVRDFLTAVYAHPNSCGWIPWGRFGNKETGEYTGMFFTDCTLTPLGEAATDLIKGEWWTKESGKTDADGVFKVFGTLGSYRVTVTSGGVTEIYEAGIHDKDHLVTLDLTFDPDQITEHEIPPEESEEPSETAQPDASAPSTEESGTPAAAEIDDGTENSYLLPVVIVVAVVVIAAAGWVIFKKRFAGKK
ncbi:MAG TPA: endo-1,4-beta-xylanase [Firmicutes bacterium]|nr:endo-1,4-beta-xylanase [Bacillota bacterium]